MSDLVLPCFQEVLPEYLSNHLKIKMVNNASEPNDTQGLATWGTLVLLADGFVCSYCE